MNPSGVDINKTPFIKLHSTASVWTAIPTDCHGIHKLHKCLSEIELRASKYYMNLWKVPIKGTPEDGKFCGCIIPNF